jgi:hypothetical protein
MSENYSVISSWVIVEKFNNEKRNLVILNSFAITCLGDVVVKVI